MSARDHDPDDRLLRDTDTDPRAFGVFYARHEDAVLAYFLRRTGSAELAADLAAETFARALASRGGFRPARGAARAWLFGIARHVLAASCERGRVEDGARRRLGMEPLCLTDEALERVEALAQAADSVVLDWVGELPAGQREALHARVVEELPYAEIAQRLRCSELVVRQRVHRALTTLRRRSGGSP